MATGVEVAGLALAVAPLVIAALEHYRDGMRAIRKVLRTKSLLKQLISSLEIQRLSYRNNLEKLIMVANPDFGFFVTLETYDPAIWKSAELDASVRDYLCGSYTAFKYTVDDYQTCMQTIALKLVGVNRHKTAAKDDLESLLFANPRNSQRRFSFKERVELAMRNREIEALIAKLEKSNLTLDRFIEHSIQMEQLTVQAAARGRPREIAAHFTIVRDHAEGLYTALYQARDEHCTAKHNVLLHLEDKTPPKKSAGAGARTQRKNFVNFVLSIAWPSQAPMKWHRGTVLFQKPKQAGNKVEDLCRVVEAVSDEHGFRFHLGDDGLRWDVGVGSARQVMETVPLASVFESLKVLAPSRRVQLALKLASSLLQLSFTRWLPHCWTREGIRFFRPAGPVASIVYFSEPLLAQTFAHDEAPPVQEALVCDPTDEIFDLGVLLIEIFFGMSFDVYLTENQLSCTDRTWMSRFPFVSKWMKERGEELPNLYRTVVWNCLRFNFGQSECSWENAGLRQAMCGAIIEPLEEECTHW